MASCAAGAAMRIVSRSCWRIARTSGENAAMYSSMFFGVARTMVSPFGNGCAIGRPTSLQNKSLSKPDAPEATQRDKILSDHLFPMRSGKVCHCGSGALPSHIQFRSVTLLPPPEPSKTCSYRGFPTGSTRGSRTAFGRVAVDPLR